MAPPPPPTPPQAMYQQQQPYGAPPVNQWGVSGDDQVMEVLQATTDKLWM